MKSLYLISLNDAKGAHVQFGVVASNMAAAVAKAQELAGVAHDPLTVQRLASVDGEAN